MNILEIHARYLQGESLRKLSQEYATTPYLIYKAFQREGLPYKSPYKPLPKDVQDKMVSDYGKGQTIKALSHKYNIPMSRVYATLTSAQVSFRGRGRSKDIPLEDIKALRDKGLSLRKIGAELGVSRTYVQNRLKELEK
jgi:hypothetical protein